ncbi:hypothetical protein NHQ30_003172 [Ciborinia camelliae]|nr:hypothetical protein NHQ30_003172 [Ciborinia camelliae]
MDPERRAMIEGRAPRGRDITSPRRDENNRISKPQRSTGNFGSRPYRNNQSLEDEQSKKWVAEEDTFVLKQAKKKADIRVREGRAKPIDWLAVILRVIDPDRDLLEVDEEEVQLDVVDPEGVFEGLNDAQLGELETDINSYISLEKNKTNQDYWKTMQIICNDRRQKLKPLGLDERAVSSVAADVDKLLGPKTYEQLESLEGQIRAKLRSNEPIDTDYWEQLLKSLLIWKAKAKLKKVYQSVLDTRLDALRKEQQEDAENVQKKLQELLSGPIPVVEEGSDRPNSIATQTPRRQPHFIYSEKHDPEPLLKLRTEDKSGEIIDESEFLKKIVAERRKVLKLGYVPSRQPGPEKSIPSSVSKPTTSVSNAPPGTQRFSAVVNEDFSQATKALYDREVARGVNENEEIFTAEESLTMTSAPQWADQYRPRKPRYFNRVQMGYEWNKYNQTHYDHDNPPPKVVQGYKFNIFYPDLIDKAKAPTFRIIREHGRKRGESFAAAGEEDTCLLRFIAGPPYEDIAFRIVDKEWDYSAKRDRGFRSSFDKVRYTSTALSIQKGQYTTESDHEFPACLISSQHHDLPWDLQASEIIETTAQSQAADIFPSFDGLPRIGQDQYFMASSSSSAMPNNDYNLTTSQMTGSQNPNSWAHQAPLTPSFGDDGNGYSYDCPADLSGLEQQQSLKTFDNIPRTTWQQPYANMTMTLPVYPFDTRENLGSMVSSRADHGERPDDCIMMDAVHKPLDSTSPSSLCSDEDGHSSREPTAMDVDADAHNVDEQPYAKLIYRALMSAPDHSMVLQEIYRWFRENTTKGSSDTKGWMNSIRHNLSMNAAFKKTERKIPGEETKKSTEWVLEDFAVRDGVQSTTRYRKGTSSKKYAKTESTPSQSYPSRHNYNAIRKPSLHSIGKGKLQRQRVREDPTSRRMLPTCSRSEPTKYPGSHSYASNMASDSRSPRRSPLTPAPESSGTYSPAIKEENYNPAYDDYRFEDCQGVLLDDQDPIFMDNQSSRFMQVHPMCASNQY